MSRNTQRVDWAFGPGKSPAMGAVNAAAAAANLTAIAHEVGTVNPWWGIGVGALAAAGSMVALAVANKPMHHEGRVMCYRVACWLGAGVWSTIQLAISPWSWNGVAALGGMAAAAAVVGKVLQRGEAKAEQEQAAKVEAAQQAALTTTHDRIAAHWQGLIRRICRTNVTVTGVKLWDDPKDGFTIELELPDDGATIDNIKPYEKALATSARLAPGCNVEVFAPGGDLGRHILNVRVNLRNAMAENQVYPRDYANRTIENPLRLGVIADRSVVGITVRHNSAVMAGQVGSGKSTVLDVATAEIVCCTDAIVAAIDLSGGGVYPRRWVRAWYEGRAERPAIDMVANTPELAELMCLGLLNVVNGRTEHYQTNKVIPSPDVPQIILIVDEFKTLPNVVKELIETISDTGRKAAVRTICCSLEAKSAAIPRSLIVQSRERIVMRVSDEAEGQYLFDTTWRSGRFDPASMTHSGMGLLSTDARPPGQFKGYWLEEKDFDQVDEIAVAVAGRRPDLDGPSAAMWDTVTREVRNKLGVRVEEHHTGVWHNRWEPVLPAMFASGEKKLRAKSTTRKATTSTVEGSMDSLNAAAAQTHQAVDAALKAAAAEDAKWEANKQREPEQGGGEAEDDQSPATPDPDPEFDELTANLRVLSARERYEHLLRRLGPTGATEIVEKLRAEGYPTTRQTVQGWLGEDEAAGKTRREDAGWVWAGGDSS